MKSNSPIRDGKSASAGSPAPAAYSSQFACYISPSRDELAKVAYFIYLEQSGTIGLNVQRWLDAQARTVAATGMTSKDGAGGGSRARWN